MILQITPNVVHNRNYGLLWYVFDPHIEICICVYIYNIIIGMLNHQHTPLTHIYILWYSIIGMFHRYVSGMLHMYIYIYIHASIYIYIYTYTHISNYTYIIGMFHLYLHNGVSMTPWLFKIIWTFNIFPNYICIYYIHTYGYRSKLGTQTIRCLIVIIY